MVLLYSCKCVFQSQFIILNVIRLKLRLKGSYMGPCAMTYRLKDWVPQLVWRYSTLLFYRRSYTVVSFGTITLWQIWRDYLLLRTKWLKNMQGYKNIFRLISVYLRWTLFQWWIHWKAENSIFLGLILMVSFTIFPAPPLAAYFLWSCDKVYHKQEVCFHLYFLGQIVSWQYNPNLLD